MRISTLFLSGAALGVLTMASLPASAAVLSVAQVTTGCPDIDQARECPALAEEFLSTRPMSRESDGQIVSLVLAIAELSQVPRVSMPVCLNAADGLRVLAGGVSSEDQEAQINDIAESLCDGTNTAAIRRGLGDINSLASAGPAGDGGGGVTSTGGGAGGAGGGAGAGGGDGGGTGGGGAGGGDGGGSGGGGGGGGAGDDGNNGHGNDDDHDDDSNPGGGGGGQDGGDDGGESGDGLGSNDAAAGHASLNGESHANDHAVNNTHGNNGD